MEKGNALIRYCFHIQPEKLAIDEWAKLYSEAIWIKDIEAKRLAEILAAVFGGKKK